MSATVYIVAGRTVPATGDVAGTLVTAEGEALWAHLSSSVDWLRRDLTDGFTDRRAALQSRYPDGYDVVVLGPDDPRPWENRGETPAMSDDVEITTSHEVADWRHALEDAEPGPELERIRARVAAARNRGENDAVVAVVLDEASAWRTNA